MEILKISQELDKLINLYIKGKIGKEQLEELRQKLNAAMVRPRARQALAEYKNNPLKYIRQIEKCGFISKDGEPIEKNTAWQAIVELLTGYDK